MVQLNDYFDIFDTLNGIVSTLPNEVSKTFEIEGFKGNIEKEGNTVRITLKKEDEKFDDKETKELVSEYKDNIKALDDDLFVEVTEELGSKLDLQKFNELLDLESFNEKQAREVEEMIDVSSDIICLHLEHKIQDMLELYEQF